MSLFPSLPFNPLFSSCSFVIFWDLSSTSLVSSFFIIRSFLVLSFLLAPKSLFGLLSLLRVRALLTTGKRYSSNLIKSKEWLEWG